MKKTNGGTAAVRVHRATAPGSNWQEWIMAPQSGTNLPKSTQPAHEAIARLAYALWEARGCPFGSPEEDWLRAEQELLQVGEE